MTYVFNKVYSPQKRNQASTAAYMLNGTIQLTKVFLSNMKTRRYLIEYLTITLCMIYYITFTTNSSVNNVQVLFDN